MREQLTMPDGFQDNEFEKETHTFIYIDHSKPEEPVVVFECKAKDILQADAQYEAYTGHDITKQPHIGCAVENPPEKSES
jgi:hypothetical protein